MLKCEQNVTGTQAGEKTNSSDVKSVWLRELLGK